MSTNVINSGNLDTLKTGETLLLRARKVKNGKVQFEWAEKIKTDARGSRTAVSRFNASDPAFSSGAQRAWFSGTVEDAKAALGIDLGDDNSGWYMDQHPNGGEDQEVIDLNILNPVDIETGEIYKMEITETVEPNEWQAANSDKAAKTAGKGGPHILHGGQLIFRNTNIIGIDPNDENSKVNHLFLKPDPRTVDNQLTDEVLDFEEVSMLDEVEDTN